MSRVLMICLFFVSTSLWADKSEITKRTTIKNPFELRDPFRDMNKQERDRKSKRRSSTDFNYLPDAYGMEFNDLMIVGILSGKERRAIVKDGEQGKEFYTLKEGMVLGDNIEVKAILPGGMVLVEKITNIYGEAEYIETVIPISK